MILSFIFFMILFLGGFWVMGISFGLPDFQALVFIGGLLLICISLAFMMREGRSGATRRSKNWDGGPAAS
ncbi:hypothetical protein OED01_11255 [Microbacterium sp. M28]|uniref:hypothetical protein n=1 Tax=Microbacterium sp. M28 TaxID=2962064 RepID=UPI0021F3DF43|nr:hypothetical protein [Microbacterium sp. M28]UYO96176.1 hypothetical protein OED01_11255 [Microbacterium sp. M28]